jgi:hypothetical protein
MTFQSSVDFTLKQTNVHYSQFTHCAGVVPDAALEKDA